MSMEVRRISGIEHSLLLGQLDDLPEDEANGLRSLLAEKYFAYLDRVMQLKMAVQEYDEAAAPLRAAQTLPLDVK